MKNTRTRTKKYTMNITLKTQISCLLNYKIFNTEKNANTNIIFPTSFKFNNNKTIKMGILN